MSIRALLRKLLRPRRVAVWLAAGAALLVTAVEAADGRPLRFRRLSTQDGLSDSTVEAIVQDRLGFMWFGTADGLSRYDGYTFKLYHHDGEKKGSISNNYIWDLMVDSEGTLWVGTGDGLNRYEAEVDAFVSYRHDSEDVTTLTNSGVLEIVEDSRGNLWVGTGGGLDRFDRASGLSTRYLHDESDPRSLSYNYVETILEDSAGRLWIGTQAGLDLYDPESDDFTNFRHDRADPASLSNDFVRVLHEDSRGDLWIGTEHGLNRMDPDQPGRFARYYHDPEDPDSLPGDLVWAVHEDRAGTLWIGTDRGGLAVLDRERNAFVAYQHDPTDPSTLGSDVVYVLYEDDVGDLWTGNYAGGVNYLDRRDQIFGHFGHDPGDPASLSHNSVLALAEDSRGNLWVGTEDGLARFDPSTGTFLSFRHEAADPQSLSAPAVLSISEDSSGRMWVGTWAGGLHLFDRARGRFERRFPAPETAPSSGSLHIQSLAEDIDGDLWLGTFDGAFRFDPDSGEVVSYSPEPGNPAAIPHQIVWATLRDDRGRLWLGTHGGLALYERERDAFRTYPRESAGDASLNVNQIAALEQDGDYLWLGTLGSGLALFDLASRVFVAAYRAPDGLASDVVNSVTVDESGDLWIGTNRGISHFDPQTRTFLSLDERDGVQGRQFNRAAIRTASGEIVLGGTHGMNQFDPAEIQPNRAIPPVVITSFQIFNRPVPISADGPLAVDISQADRVTLDHDQSVFTFEFAALSFSAPTKNRYAYMLVGFDEEWIEPQGRRSATYTHLNPGTYTFRVRASNNSGVWNEEGASLEVVIKPPFWATWWFRTLAVLAVTAVATLGHRARVRGFTERARLLQNEIDERKRAEAARERLIAELEESRATLERQNAELERFAYTVSHDLKSPLVTIQGFLAMLEKDAVSGRIDRVKRDMQQIRTATETMSRLLNDLLELARVGRVADPSEELSLSELAREAVEHLSGSISSRGVKVEVDPGLPRVRGDRSRLFEVFQNLIENAIKFMGGQRHPRIEIGARRGGGEVVCFVRDNGSGIEPSYHSKVFGLFERLGADAEGSGIGLALVKRIVEVHGGRIWVESAGRGKGATFCFVLRELTDEADRRLVS